MRGSSPKVGATLPNRQAIFVAHQTIYRLTEVCRTGNLTSANGDEPMARLKLPEALASQAAGSAVDAFILRLKIAMGKNVCIPMEFQFRANAAASGAAGDAEGMPGADVLSVYDAAFNAAFTSLTARFDPTAEEMLAYERSVGQ